MKSKIISNQKINEKFGVCEISSSIIAKESSAGRFIMISTIHDKSLSYDPILNRPFAIADVNGDIIKFIYMIVGRGTKRIQLLKAGDTVEVIGALGNRFNITTNLKSVAVLAGGIGIAPCISLGRALKSAGIKATLYYGGRQKGDILFRELLADIYDTFKPITEDGSLGEQGLITAPFLREISAYDKIFACGPNRMLEAVTKIATDNGKPIEVSLEERMACGVGACLGCVVDIKEKDKIVKKRCCVEGPIFDGSKVDWGILCNR